MKKQFFKVLALILAMSCLLSTTALSVDISESVSGNTSEDLTADVLSAERYARCYDKDNYENEFALGQVFLTLKSTVPEVEDYAELFPEVDVDSVEVLSEKFIVLHLEEKSRQSVIDAINELKDNEYVKIAEPNYKVYLDAAVMPNDVDYNQLWHIQKVEADYAWNITTGSSNVKVGVIDTGISAVADLAANVDLESGINFLDPTSLPTDTYGHGTHVAGIIGAVGNNEIGVAGVCWNVTMIPFKMYDITNTTFASGIVYGLLAATEMELDIVNISMRTSSSEGMLEAIQGYEGLIVVSAGNENTDLANVTRLPASFGAECDNMVVVGNSDANDTRYVNPHNSADGSNYGDEEVHLFAPGVSIYSTYRGSYACMTGTSMAAPMVAGAAALIMSEHPNATVEQVKDAIIYSVNKSDALADCCITGGVLNVRRALEYLSDLHGNGDVNMDDSISNLDLVKLMRYLDNPVDYGLTEDQIMRADINKDNDITDADLQALSRLLVQRSFALEVQ